MCIEQLCCLQTSTHVLCTMSCRWSPTRSFGSRWARHCSPLKHWQAEPAVVLLESCAVDGRCETESLMTACSPSTHACPRRCGLRHWRRPPLQRGAAAWRQPSWLQSVAARRWQLARTLRWPPRSAREIYQAVARIRGAAKRKARRALPAGEALAGCGSGGGCTVWCAPGHAPAAGQPVDPAAAAGKRPAALLGVCGKPPLMLTQCSCLWVVTRVCRVVLASSCITTLDYSSMWV